MATPQEPKNDPVATNSAAGPVVQPQQMNAAATQPYPAKSTAVDVEDRSKYIRTMAKDMAVLGGTTPVKGALPEASQAKQPESVKIVSGVTLPVAEEPFFSKPQVRAKEIPQETVALPSIKEAGEIVSPVSAPVETLKTVNVLASEKDRDTILERLRTKVGESARMSIRETAGDVGNAFRSWPDIPAPSADFRSDAKIEVPPARAALMPPTPAELPTPTPLPQPETSILRPKSEWGGIAVPLPSFPPVTPVERSPLPVSPAAAKPVAPDGLHTYSGDFSDRIDTRAASTFSVLAAQQDAGNAPAPSLSVRKAPNTRAIASVFAGILLVTLAAGGIYATYRFVMTMRDTPLAAVSVPSIVFADEYRELSGTGPALMQALATAAGGTLVPGNVLLTYITDTSPDAEGVQLSRPAGGDAFLRALMVPAPDILLRNISEESSVGVVNAGGQTSAFFALRVTSYERTYAGMLTWEPLLLRDLGSLYPLYPAEIPETPAVSMATSTASTTPAAPAEPVQARALTRFTDAIVANHDVRVLRDTDGKSLIIYGYADKRTLILARDEASFEAILARLKSE